MKILQVVNSLQFGGAEKLISELIPRIKNHGYDIGVLVFDGRYTNLMKHLIDNDVHVIKLSNESTNPYSIKNLIKLIPVIRNYDIVHSHTTPAQFFCFLAKLIFPSLILVTTEHSTFNRRRGNKFLRIIDKIMYSYYDKIICIGKKPKDNLERQIGQLGKKAVVIENGIDINSYETAVPVSRNDISCSNGDFILTMVGRFTDAKDQITIIKALSSLPSLYKLVLVGDGPFKVSACKYAENLGLNNRVVFLGLRNDVPSILKAADVVILSSHWEGFGLAAVEGMAANKPVIATNVPGMRDVVEGAGMLFDVGDAETLSKIVIKLHDDKGFYQLISNQCFVRAQKYDIGKVVQSYENVYNEYF